MSKKMLKRSLALGALMAFVITGSAWAADSVTEVKNNDISTFTGNQISGTGNGLLVVNDGKVYKLTIGDDSVLNITGTLNSNNIDNNTPNGGIFVNGKDSSLTIDRNVSVNVKGTDNKWMTGIHNFGGTSTEDAAALNVNKNISLTVTADETYSKNLMGVRTYNSTTNFKGNETNITINNNSSASGQHVYGVASLGTGWDADSKPVYTVVNFESSNTSIVLNNSNNNAIAAYGVLTSAANASANFKGKDVLIDVNSGNASYAIGLVNQYNASMNSAENNNLQINVDGNASDLMSGIYSVEEIDFKGNTIININNDGEGLVGGVYGEDGADIDLADTTITATSEGARAQGIYVDDSTIDVTGVATITATSNGHNAYGVRSSKDAEINLANTTITANSKNRHAYGFSSENSSYEVDGDVSIETNAGGRADGMNLVYSSIEVGGKLTVEATGVSDGSVGAQGIKLDYSQAVLNDVDLTVKSTEADAYGIRMLGDAGATNSQVDISGSADIYSESQSNAYGIVVSTGADLGVADDLSDVGNALNITVKGKNSATGIRTQYGSDVSVSADTNVNVIATSENGSAYGVVNSYLTYDSVNYAKANADISILGNVNIEANGKTGSYAVYNSTDYNKKDAEDVGATIIGGVGKKVTITGDMYANSGSITTTFGAEGSQFDGKVETVGKGTTTINFAKGATWNLSEASTVSNVTFESGSVFNIDGTKYTNAEYALIAAGSEKSLTITNGAKLAIKGIEEGVTYNIAKGFGVDTTEGEKWTIDNNLLSGVWDVDTTVDGLQVTTKAKDASEIASDMGVDSGTASALGSIIEAANTADEVEGTPAANVVAFAEEIAKAPAEVAAAAAEAVIKMAEAGGNSATAANIVKNVTGVTNDRLSFNCGHSAPHKGGHGVGLLEEGSGADIWAEYVHGKDKVEDMPSTAGATSYEGQYNGFVMGVDFKKVNKFQSGLAFNYGEGDTNTVGSAVRTRSDYDFWGVGYYGNIHNDDSNVIFDINYAKTDSDVTQNNLTGDLEASPETTTWTAGVKLEKLYQNENVQIVPYTGLRYMSIDSDDYATKCGTYKYSMDRQDIWLLPVGVSIKQEIVNDNGWTVSPRVDLSYIWAFGDTDSNMEFATALNTKTNIGYDVMDDGSFLGLVGIEAHKGQWGYGVAYSYQKGDHSESKKWYVDVNYSF